MDFRDALLRIGSEFLAAREEPFGGHSLANFIRRDVPEILERQLGGKPNDMVIEGSPGRGNWNLSPWIRVADMTVSDSATRGYYVAYLFTVDMRAVVLTLAQGTTSVRAEFGKETHRVLQSKAQVLASKVPESRAQFSAEAISLRLTTLAARDQDREDWEASSAFGKEYALANLPPSEILIGDLELMIRLYRLAIQRGGTEVLESTEDDPDRSAAVDADLSEVEGRRRLQRHKRIERSRRLALRAKTIHGTQCQGCGFDFGRVYGQRGIGYIEAHHLVPLSRVTEEGGIRRDPRSDFAVLCANCHRMIHRLETPPLEEFRKSVHRGLLSFLSDLA